MGGDADAAFERRVGNKMTTSSSGLRDLGLADEYRSDAGSLAERLWTPCLAVATSYDRAVGYFTSSALQLISSGLGQFVQHGGRMRLVASPNLRPEDVEAILSGLRRRSEAVETALLRELATTPVLSGVRLLGQLVASGRLEVRIAIPKELLGGIYHEKVAIFGDALADYLAVSGSANETVGGLRSNLEVVEVFSSWSGEKERVARKRRHFERLWVNKDPAVDVLDLPEAVRQRLVEIARDSSAAAPHTDLPSPGSAPLRNYQVRALEAWTSANYRGTLAMATGTGKTLTASAAIEHVSRANGPLAVLVLVPLIHLATQWVDVLRTNGLSAVACHGNSDSWVASANESLDFLRGHAVSTTVLVSTYATAALPAMTSLLQRLASTNLLVIGDEVHRLGSEGMDAILPRAAQYRLGLSATPERWEDPAGTARIVEYFGDIVFGYDIDDAISDGVLTPYEYLPVMVELTEGELDEYDRVVAAIDGQLAKEVGRRDRQALARLSAERAHVLNSASGKLGVVRREVPPSATHALAYCANRRQLSAVMDILWDRGIPVRQFTGEEDSKTRQATLAGLEDGSIPIVAAIRCLDEGVDVPAVTTAYLLASSGNPLQFVQRRGRLLRQSPGKSKASIFDLVVAPKSKSARHDALLERELRRVEAFASSALNRDEALARIAPMLDAFGGLEVR